MAYRKYDTCFFERYAMLSLQTILGHKFDTLVNEDRPDLQSEDGVTLGIEVTRAMPENKESAQQMLKDLAGLRKDISASDKKEFEDILKSGYGYGLQGGKYIGRLEIDYWKNAKPLRDIIRSKVSKVSSGFYGNFKEFGLYVFCKDPISEADAYSTLNFIMDLQKDLEIKYDRLFLSTVDSLIAFNLSDDISYEYRLSSFPLNQSMKKEFYLSSILLEDK